MKINLVVVFIMIKMAIKIFVKERVNLKEEYL